jgi:hypothetical protein
LNTHGLSFFSKVDLTAAGEANYTQVGSKLRFSAIRSANFSPWVSDIIGNNRQGAKNAKNSLKSPRKPAWRLYYGNLAPLAAWRLKLACCR